MRICWGVKAYSRQHGNYPETGLWEAKVVLGASWANGRTSGAELAGTFNKSECTRGSEMRGAYLPFSHTASGDGETDSAMRRYVLRPSAIAPARYHVSYCALRAEAGSGGHARHAECARHRRPGLPADYPGDSGADHAGLGAAEGHRAKVEPELNRDSWRRSV